MSPLQGYGVFIFAFLNGRYPLLTDTALAGLWNFHFRLLQWALPIVDRLSPCRAWGFSTLLPQQCDISTYVMQKVIIKKLCINIKPHKQAYEVLYFRNQKSTIPNRIRFPKFSYSIQYLHHRQRSRRIL